MSSSPPNKQRRHRRSRKYGSSWTARSKRLRDLMEIDVTHQSLAATPGRTDTHHSQQPVPILHSGIARISSPLPHVQETATQSPVVGLGDAIMRNREACQQLQERIGVLSKEVILGIVTLYGAVAFTTRQYDHMRWVISVVDATFSLPSSSSLRKVKWPFFVNHLFPKSSIIRFSRTTQFIQPVARQVFIRDSGTLPVQDTADNSDTRSHHSSDDGDDGDARETEQAQDVNDDDTLNGNCHSITEVAVVPISEWAKIDISNVLLRDDLVKSQITSTLPDQLGKTSERCIEQSALLTDPESSKFHQDDLFVNRNDYTYRCSRHDVLKFQCIPSNNYTIPESFVDTNTHAGSESTITVIARVSFTFCPGAASSTMPENSSLKSDYLSVPVSTLSDSERLLLKFLKMSVQSRTTPSRGDTPFTVHPGDVCTVLLPDQSDERDISQFSLLCNRFWRTEDDNANQLFLSFLCDFTEPSRSNITLKCSAELQDVPEVDDSKSPPQPTSFGYRRPTFGTLRDGRRFYVYRVLLYCDDFVPRGSLFRKGSVGGCYFIPLSFGIKRRRGISAIRTISLTPKGVSTNFVLDHIIDDILYSTTEGIEARDADGEKVYIFVEVEGFIGDYPESAKVIDVLNHSARAPCPSCSFRHRTFLDSAKFAYSVAIHSFHSSFRRTLRRTLAMRAAGISADDMRFLGMTEGSVKDIYEKGRWPLVKLACKLDEVRHRIPKTSDNMPVVSGIFDPYSNNVVAPDHLLAGLGKSLITCIFLSLSSNTLRSKLEVLICRDISLLGHGSHSSLFNFTKNTLNSTSMSTVYAILLVILPHLNNLNDNVDAKILDITKTFRKLVALTFWWPLPGTDSADSFELVHGDNQLTYHKTMLDLANSFVQDIDVLCSSCDYVLNNLDRPNLHRLLELYRHTIPRYSHALFCCDMAFEHNHQPLKATLLRNSNPKCHVSAVHQILGRDWFGRVCELVAHSKTNNDEHSKGKYQRSLRRLFFGAIIDNVSLTDSVSADLEAELDEHIHGVLDDSIACLLQKWYGSHLTCWGTGQWKGFRSSCSDSRRREQSSRMQVDPQHELFTLCAPNIIDEAADTLQRHLASEGIDECITVFDRSFFEQKFGKSVRRRYSHHHIHFGDFFECFIHSTCESGTIPISSPSTDGTGEHCVFQVQALMGYSVQSIWALAIKGVPDSSDSNVYNFEPSPTSTTTLVYFSSSVRKCFGIHACRRNGLCTIDGNTRTITHNFKQNSVFTILLRKNGYPPRRS